MLHRITLNTADFSQTIKDATVYACKKEPHEAMGHMVLAIVPRQKKLAVIACDGQGYYERRIPLVISKGSSRPSLPGKDSRILISCHDAVILAKFMSAVTSGSVTLEADDSQITESKYTVRLILNEGASTTFFSRNDLHLPDYSSITKQAEKGRKTCHPLSNVLIPIREMLRVSKVFPATANKFARIFTAKGLNRSIMALLEYQEEDKDIRVIFMLNEDQPATEAA